MSTISNNEPIHIQSENINIWDTIWNIANCPDQEHPFFIFDVNDIIQKYKAWKCAMPRVKPHYAVKCNDHPVVLKTMAALGAGFDCATELEIDKMLALGVNPSRIIYAHTIKPPSHLRHAAKVKVDLITFDNEEELYKIKDLFPEARIVIRIKYDAKAAVCLGLKFGCDPHSEAPKLLEIARDLELNVTGVSFHVGWGCRDPSAFHGAIAASRHVFDVAYAMGYDFKLLDIGGGYPGELGTSIDEYGKVINSALEEFFLNKSVEVIAEPGTYFVDSAFSLVCNIISAKKIVNKDSVNGKSGKQYMYYVNEGVYGSLRRVVTANILKIPYPLKEYSGLKKYSSIVWGPTCDSTDKIVGDVLLPKMQVRDWIVFRNVGAYTLTVCTPFNGFAPPNVYSIINPHNWSHLCNKPPLVEEDFAYDCQQDKSKISDPYLIEETRYDFPENFFLRR